MREITCLITGANSGIGKEVALGLAKLGAQVIMVCRHPQKGQAALDEIKRLSGSSKVDLIFADLSSQAELRTLAKTIYSRYPALHVLINNAGLVLAENKYSVDGIEMTLATNHLAPFLLSQLLLDLLKASAPSRIINVSSAAQQWGQIELDDLQFEKRKYQFMKAYAQSKLLMNATTFEMARRLEGSGVTVNCLHPGAINTNLGDDNPNNMILRAIGILVKKFFVSPAEGARTPIYLATSAEVVTGKYFVKCKQATSKILSEDVSKRIWEISEKLTQEGSKASS